MEVAASSYRCRENHAGSIDSLPNFEEVASSGNLFDQNRCKPLATKLLVNTQKVDLRAIQDFATHPQLDWDTGNEGNEFASSICCADTYMPLFLPVRRFESPVEECRRVFKSEHGFIIFNVVIGEQFINFSQLATVSKISLLRMLMGVPRYHLSDP